MDINWFLCLVKLTKMGKQIFFHNFLVDSHYKSTLIVVSCPFFPNIQKKAGLIFGVFHSINEYCDILTVCLFDGTIFSIQQENLCMFLFFFFNLKIPSMSGVNTTYTCSSFQAHRGARRLTALAVSLLYS